MIESALLWIVAFVKQFGYFGLFVMTFLESTMVPLPSEITIVPAGYLIHTGEMQLIPVLLSCILGTMSGSFFMYWLAKRFGRTLVHKYGIYFLFPPAKLKFVERYFEAHGKISVFTARLIPAVRHLISFPAGLASMPLPIFTLFTFVGSTLWIIVLLLVGYFIGDNKEMLGQYIIYIKGGAVTAVALMIGVYIFYNKRKNKQK